MEENNNFLYKGYLLVIDVGGWAISAKCKELGYEDYDYSIPLLKNDFKKFVDKKLVGENNKMTEKTYEEVKKEWGSNCKKVTYKNQVMWVTALERTKDSKVLYIGTFSYKPQNEYWSQRKSFESIHYDKVISRFERFVNEYCTDWEFWKEFYYNDYLIEIKQEKGDKNNFLGIVRFHKNSTFKCIADNVHKVESLCNNRIDKVKYEKEKVKMISSKQEKIQELEQLLAKISTQLEELKNEKDSLTYKDVILEISKSSNGSYHGTLKDITKPAPFIADNLEELQKAFESYVDRLEGQYILFCRLTGKN